jgi:hypothetical protein
LVNKRYVGRRQKQLKKKSTVAVEELVSSLILEKDQQTFAPFLEATAAPRDCFKGIASKISPRILTLLHIAF